MFQTTNQNILHNQAFMIQEKSPSKITIKPPTRSSLIDDFRFKQTPVEQHWCWRQTLTTHIKKHVYIHYILFYIIYYIILYCILYYIVFYYIIYIYIYYMCSRNTMLSSCQLQMGDQLPRGLNPWGQTSQPCRRGSQN